ncbi:cGMP-dependent protein kinase 1 [Thelohanellus kitauei]|uniref:cGMP-dependent protein kinase 1 n=1 Tax=Thelohanellus kitauei TaxID=669202 RepID=A0A0C2M7A7_THEKT|nr:cGMP-dependent protein kinase 1 [Thelohanellus kitauei]
MDHQPSSLDFRSQALKRVTIDDLHTVTTLDMDTFSRTDLMVLKSDPRVSYALKTIKKMNILVSKLQDNIINEKKLLMQIDCNFVVKLFKTFKDRKYVYMLMEACLGGNLAHLIREQLNNLNIRGRLTEEMAKFYVACVVEAIKYLHSINIIHRDIKPANIMIDDKGYCKLANFMYSKKLDIGRKTFTFCGSPEYVAPELIMNTGHDSAVDIWALGILIYELLAGFPPFSGDDPMKTYNIIMKGFETIGFPAIFGRNAQNLVQKLCCKNPNSRLGYAKHNIGEIQKHKWFDGFNWQKLRNLCLEPPIIPSVKDMTESIDDDDEFPHEDKIPPDETSGWDRDF